MSALYSVTMIDSSGDAQIGLDVDLYAGDGTGAKTGDFTDNGDGTYRITVTASGKYTVKVGGVTQTELQSVYIPVDDLLTTADIINNLTTGGTSDALSAEQGKTLNTTKVNVSDIINDLTTGGTNKPLSAEQGKTLNTNKLSASDIINNLTTGGTTKALSAEQGKTLSGLIGTFNWVGSLLETLNPTNLIDAIKSIASMVKSLYDAFTNGTAIYNRRVIFSANTQAAAADGSEAAAVTEWLEDSDLTGQKDKIRGSFKKLTGDKYLVFNCYGKIAVATETMFVHLHISGSSLAGSAETIQTSYTVMTISVDISTLTDNTIYEYYIEQFTDNGTQISSMKDPEVLITGA